MPTGARTYGVGAGLYTIRSGLHRPRRERAEAQGCFFGTKAVIDDNRPVGKTVTPPRPDDTRLRIGVEPETRGQRDIRDTAAGHQGKRGTSFFPCGDALLDRDIDRQLHEWGKGEAEGKLALLRPLQRDRRAAIGADAAGIAEPIGQANPGLTAAKLTRAADGFGRIPRPFAQIEPATERPA